MAITENQAAVCFRLTGGKVDYASFFGEGSFLCLVKGIVSLFLE
jgi:hypothetical protein